VYEFERPCCRCGVEYHCSQSVAVCCSALRCVAVCVNLSGPVAAAELSIIAPSLLQRVAVCCGVLQCV